MIIYLFNDQFFTKVNLPSIVNGMYSLSEEEKLVANILSNGKNWEIELSPDFVCDQITDTSNELVLYKVYNIKSKIDGDNYTIVAIPKYDESFKLYSIKDSITIGNNPSCDICYVYDQNVTNGQEALRLTKINNSYYWSLETNSNNFILDKGHARSGLVIKNGNYVFYYGLKVVVMGNTALINNPNSLVKINNEVITEQPSVEEFNIDTVTTKVKQDEPLYKKEDYFYKAPRFNFVLEKDTVDIDEPPTRFNDSEKDIPGIVILGPQITMVTTSVLSMLSFLTMYTSGSGNTLRLIVTISMTLTTIAGAILWPNITRKVNKKRLASLEKKRNEKYSKYLERKNIELENIKNKQRDTLIQNHPSAVDCSKIIENRKKELWQRNIDHDDFLKIRVGLGTINTLLNINIPKERFTVEDEDQLFVKMKEIIDNSLYIQNAPITYSFTEQNVSGIVGRSDLVKRFMDNVFLQMMTFHSYTDLKFVVFTKEPDKWNYLKVIPHCWDNHKNTRYFTTSVEDLSFICSELEKTFDSRVIDDEKEKVADKGEDKTENNAKKYRNFKPYYLFFIDDISSLRNIPLINKILYYKKNIGFSIVLTSESISLLPSEASNFISVGDPDSAILTSRVLEELGYEVEPKYNEERVDIVQNIIFRNPDKLIEFTRGIQEGSAIDSNATVEPGDMPGYEDKIIMASGSFTQGSSIELSCDGPLREPYIAYMQGSLTYPYGKLGLMKAIEKIGE